jgi:hypothetical protein
MTDDRSFDFCCDDEAVRYVFVPSPTEALEELRRIRDEERSQLLTEAGADGYVWEPDARCDTPTRALIDFYFRMLDRKVSDG